MSDTNKNIITLAEIGAQFHEARVHRGVLIEDVAKTLKISSKILRAIEDGNREELPQLVFLRGFLKSYGIFLGFPDKDLQKALAYLEQIEPKPTFVNPHGDEKPLHVGTVNDPEQQEKQKKFVRATLATLVAVGVVIYSLYLFSNNLSDDDFAQNEEIIVAESSEIAQEAVLQEDENLQEVAVVEEDDKVGIADMVAEVEAGANSDEITEIPKAENTQTAELVLEEEEKAEAVEVVEEAEENVSVVAEREEVKEELFDGLPVVFQRIGFFGGGEETLVVQATADCWLTFTLDGPVAQNSDAISREAFLRRGQEMLLSFDEDVVMRLGNAGGVGMVLNGKSIGSPGRSGQVITVRYTVDGMD